MREIEQSNYKLTIKFEHEEYGTTVRKVEIDSCAPWTDHLCEFVDILGQVYGYPIKDKVAAGGMVWGRWLDDERPTFDHTEGKVYKHDEEGYGEAPGFRRNNQEF